jgi:hypothetical protein
MQQNHRKMAAGRDRHAFSSPNRRRGAAKTAQTPRQCQTAAAQWLDIR